MYMKARFIQKVAKIVKKRLIKINSSDKLKMEVPMTGW